MTAYICLPNLLEVATRTPVSVDSTLDYFIVFKHEWIDLQHLFAQLQWHQVLFWFHSSAQRQLTVTAPFTLSLPYWQRTFSEWLQTNLALNWGSSSFSIFTHFLNFPVKVKNILGDNGRPRHCLCRVKINCNEPTRKSSFLPEVLFIKTSYLLVPCIDNLILQNKQKIYKVLTTLLFGSHNRTFNFYKWNTCKQFLTTLLSRSLPLCWKIGFTSNDILVHVTSQHGSKIAIVCSQRLLAIGLQPHASQFVWYECSDLSEYYLWYPE